MPKIIYSVVGLWKMGLWVNMSKLEPESLTSGNAIRSERTRMIHKSNAVKSHFGYQNLWKHVWGLIISNKILFMCVKCVWKRLSWFLEKVWRRHGGESSSRQWARDPSPLNKVSLFLLPFTGDNHICTCNVIHIMQSVENTILCNWFYIIASHNIMMTK